MPSQEPGLLPAALNPFHGQLAELFSQYPSVFAICCFIFGSAIGSFLNVVIARLPRIMENDWRQQCEQLLQAQDRPDSTLPDSSENAPSNTNAPRFNLAYPSSHCPHCQHPIRAHENIPILSWLALRGRCSNCKSPISIQYPAVELLTGLGCAGLALHHGYNLQWLGATLIWLWLIPMVGIDLKKQWLPDNQTLSLLWLGLAASLLPIFATPIEAISGAILGYLILWSVANGYKLLTKIDGMGYGDLKLLAALGAWMGPAALPAILILSTLSGAIIGISLMLIRGADRRLAIPFGPFLALGGMITLIWGEPLTQTWLELTRF